MEQQKLKSKKHQCQQLLVGKSKCPSQFQFNSIQQLENLRKTNQSTSRLQQRLSAQRRYHPTITPGNQICQNQSSISVTLTGVVTHWRN